MCLSLSLNSLSHARPRNCSRHRVKTVVKTKMKCVCVAFFTCSRQSSCLRFQFGLFLAGPSLQHQVLERESALGLLTVRNRRAIDRTALRAGLWRSPETPSQTPEGIGDALSAGVTGENSPLFTNQPAKMKTDRVLVKYFFAGTTWLRHTNASSPSSNPRLKECDSWMEQIKLLGRPVARCLANAAKQRP